MSDHGENLYEYDNGMGHGEHLRSPYSLKVPCIIYGPGIPIGQSYETRSLIDIAPTVLSYLGIDQPASFRGKPLTVKSTDAPVYSETGLWFDTAGDFFFQKMRLPYPDITGLSEIEFRYNGEIVLKQPYLNYSNTAKHRAIISNGWKLIYIPTENGVVYELYNITKDPDERHNLAGTDASHLDSMKRTFFNFMSIDTNSLEKNGYLLPLFDDPIF
jgi:arylsulfatase A-like enzyme